MPFRCVNLTEKKRGDRIERAERRERIGRRRRGENEGGEMGGRSRQKRERVRRERKSQNKQGERGGGIDEEQPEREKMG